MAKKGTDNDDQPDGTAGHADDSADNFALPDIEYKPLDRDQEPVREEVIQPVVEHTPEEEAHRSQTTPPETDEEYDDEAPSKAPLFITLIIIVVVLVAGFLVYKYWYVPKAEKEKLELARAQAEKQKADEAAKLAAANAAAEKHRLDSIAAANVKPLEGTIETLTDRTRRFYVVVTSDIDDDLIMDFAKKLSKKGVSSKIIPAYGTSKFFRLAIADFESYNEAQSSADASKAEYGNGLWVIKY